MGAKARKKREARLRKTVRVDGLVYYADELARIHNLILRRRDLRYQKLAHDLIRRAVKDQPNRHAA
jgi:hypothetical protein